MASVPVLSLRSWKFRHQFGNYTLHRFQIVLLGKNFCNITKYYHSNQSCGQIYGCDKTLLLLKR